MANFAQLDFGFGFFIFGKQFCTKRSSKAVWNKPKKKRKRENDQIVYN